MDQRGTAARDHPCPRRTGRRLDLPIGDTAAEAAAAALEQLRRDATGEWLLIFDNAEDPEDLAPFLPTGSGHILITSRNQAWTRHAEPVELDVFSRQESLAHLRTTFRD